MNPRRKHALSALMVGLMVSVALLNGTAASGGEAPRQAGQGLTAPNPGPKAALLLPAVQAAREAARAGDRGQSKPSKPPKDIVWPVPICKLGPGCPP